MTANAVRGRHIGHDALAALKTLVGGEIGRYRQLLTESRREALQRMEEEAEAMGADAVVALRLTTSPVIGGASEILAYGTAVKFR